MSKIDDGGPASATPAIEDGEIVGVNPGLTVRDVFAAHALTGMGMWIPPQGMNSVVGGPIDQNELRRIRAEWAYAQADAMLAARKS